MPQPGPRRLALLAILAAAGTRGITREKVLGILWPERDEEQARHTLSQTLYLLRKEVSEKCVTGSTQLRLDISLPDDISRFNEALSSGRLADAAELYTGPFLDGFYLAGAPEFETWVEDTRSRLQSNVRKALESLARTAEPPESAGWWQRLLDLDPFNSTYAAGHIRALSASGDVSRALGVAREYQARVRHELDAGPDPAITALIEQLRRVPAQLTGTPTSPTATEQTATPVSVAATSAPDENNHGAPPTRRRFWLPAAAISLMTVGAVAWRLGGALFAGTPNVPFIAVGSIQSSDSGASGSVLRDMLSTNLSSLGGIRVVANSRILELLSPADSLSALATKDAARRAGAHEIIEGELRASPRGLTLTMRRVAIGTGEVLQGYTVSAAEIFALTDSATYAISADFGFDPPPGTVATVSTRSSVAYALYEQGLRAFYAGDFQSVGPLMHAALARDSNFAMAALYAWRTSIALDLFDQANRDLPIVKRLASRAPERERLHVEAMVAYHSGAPLSEFRAAAERLVERYPEDPDAHVLFAMALATSWEPLRTIDEYNRAIAIDSAAGVNDLPYCRICNAGYGIRVSYLFMDSVVAAENTARRIIALRPRDANGWLMLVEPLLRQGRRSEAEAANAKYGRMIGSEYVDRHSLDRDLIRTGRLEELEARLVAELQTTPREIIGERAWLLAFVLRNQGRLREAQALTANGIVPGMSRPLAGYRENVQLAIALLEGGDPRQAGRTFLQFAEEDRQSKGGIGVVARALSWHLTLAATALAAAGDTAAVRALADSVHRIGQRSSVSRDRLLHHFLHGLLFQKQNRHAEAVEAFRRAIQSPSDGYTRINLELARSLVVLGRYDDAMAVLRPALRGGVDGSNTYVTHTELREALAHAFHAAGQRDSAAAYYGAVSRAWQHADPQFAERLQVARSRSKAD